MTKTLSTDEILREYRKHAACGWIDGSTCFAISGGLAVALEREQIRANTAEVEVKILKRQIAKADDRCRCPFPQSGGMCTGCQKWV